MRYRFALRVVAFHPALQENCCEPSGGLHRIVRAEISCRGAKALKDGRAVDRLERYPRQGFPASNKRLLNAGVWPDEKVLKKSKRLGRLADLVKP